MAEIKLSMTDGAQDGKGVPKAKVILSIDADGKGEREILQMLSNLGALETSAESDGETLTVHFE